VGSYAVSKTAGERYIADSGVSYVSLRLANIYGPRNLSGPVPTFYQRLADGRPCTVVDARRDYVFVDDLVDVAMRAAMSGGGPYHVSSGRDVSIAELYVGVVAAMGIEAPEATPVARGADDVAALLLDPRDTEWEWGWHATTPLADGLRRAVDWYADNGVSETFTHLAMKG
jgi:UDP-glucose 4-epimerase